MEEYKDINQTNFDEYEKERDELLKKYPGQYVAYSGGKRILIGVDENIIYHESRKIVPKGAIVIMKIIPKDQEDQRPFELRTPSFGRLEDKLTGREQ